MITVLLRLGSTVCPGNCTDRYWMLHSLTAARSQSVNWYSDGPNELYESVVGGGQDRAPQIGFASKLYCSRLFGDFQTRGRLLNLKPSFILVCSQLQLNFALSWIA